MKVLLLLMFAVFWAIAGFGQKIRTQYGTMTLIPTFADHIGGTDVRRTHGSTQSRAIAYLLSQRREDGSWNGDAELTSVVLASITTSEEQFRELDFRKEVECTRVFLERNQPKTAVPEIVTNTVFLSHDPCGYVEKYKMLSAPDAAKKRKSAFTYEYRLLECCQMSNGSFFSNDDSPIKETALCVLILNRIAELLWTNDALRGFQTDYPIPDSLAVVDAMWQAGALSNMNNIVQRRLSCLDFDTGAYIVDLNLKIRSRDRAAVSNAMDKVLSSGWTLIGKKFDAIYPELCRTITNAVENAIQKEEQGQTPRELYFRKWLDALHEDGLF